MTLHFGTFPESLIMSSILENLFIPYLLVMKSSRLTNEILSLLTETDLKRVGRWRGSFSLGVLLKNVMV